MDEDRAAGRAMAPDEFERLIEQADILGDVAIVSIPPGQDRYKEDAARAIMAKRGKVKTVLNKITKLEHDFRIPRYEILAGNDTIACYREFGFTYRFDVTRAFFNGRLGYERQRIASMLMPGETVLIPFAGVGPFAIPIAARGCRVIAVEMSGEACRWLASNARLNGVEDKIGIIKADAFNTPLLFSAGMDRAVVPTPYGMDKALEIMAPRVKKGGMVHFYTFKKKYQIEGLIAHYESMGLKVEHYRRCGNVAPGVSRWAFDLRVK